MFFEPLLRARGNLWQLLESNQAETFTRMNRSSRKQIVEPPHLLRELSSASIQPQRSPLKPKP